MAMTTIRLTLPCRVCSTELEESEMFEYGGTVACERCVRDYYRDRPDELRFELESRRKNALAWLNRNRRSIEKEAASRAASK
jgi:hypothetical protein